MLTTRPRRSTSAVSYSESEATVVRGHVDELQLLLQDGGQAPTSDTLNRWKSKIDEFRKTIVNHERPNRLRDAFRSFEGFQLILGLLRWVSPTQSSPEPSRDSAETVLGFVVSILGLHSAVLKDHWGNCKFFRTRVEKNGWESLEELLLETLKQQRDHENAKSAMITLFGNLLAFALQDESASTFLRSLDELPRTPKQDAAEGIEGETSTVCGHIRSSLGERPHVFVPQFLWLVLSLWSKEALTTLKPGEPLSLNIPLVVHTIVASSPHNLISLHNTGALSILLPLLDESRLDSALRKAIENLSICFLRNGTERLRDAQLLYEKSSRSSTAAHVLLSAVGHFNPPCVQFDLSQYGYSSIELPVIGRDFPPSSSAHGYTLFIWLQIVHFDAKAHTTLFGAFDSSQKCFVLVYIEKDTKNLILQTSVTSSRPSVRFKSCTFEESKWYHVAIVHRRPKITSSSRASLFINGEFVEQVKAHFPSAPAPAQSSPRESDSNGTRSKHNPVQAFLGTPQDLATKRGPAAANSNSRWCFAAAVLLGEALSDDLIAVYTQLGPRYYGNYQDCLGSFQTYAASAALNLRNENLHPGKEEQSDIVAAIRSKASALLPESKVLFNVSPMMVFDESTHNTLAGTALSKSFSKTAYRNLRNATRDGRAAIAVNGATAAINEALLHRSGMALLTGSPTVMIPQALDEATWRMGGCAPIVLYLLEAAQTYDEIIRALSILFQVIKNNWRNSEAMERENGFGVLANLLSSKLRDMGPSADQTVRESTDGESPTSRDLAFDILEMVLEFVGYDKERRENSIIINPLAYRILLVDLDLWRLSTPKVQRLYYEQFETFVLGSKYHNFNAKRLARMRIIRKWLDALKSETFYKDTLASFLRAFRSLLNGVFSAETHRWIALYISYAVFKPNDRTPLPRSAKSVKRKQTLPNSAHRPAFKSIVNGQRTGEDRPTLTLHQVGVQVLAMYVDLLCQKETENVRKFARTVTNKWLLHLLADEDSTVVGHVTKLLARVLIVNGPSYVQKFSEKTGGFVVMQHRLRRWWNHKAPWLACFAILFGLDVASIDFEAPFSLASLLTAFNPAEIKVRHPGIIFAICSMLQSGLKTIIQNEDDPGSPPPPDPFGHNASEPKSLGHRHSRSRSKSLQVDTRLKDPSWPAGSQERSIDIIQTAIRFLADLHTNFAEFRDFAVTSIYGQELISILFPLLVSTDTVSPETELNSRDSALTFNGSDVIMRPMSRSSQKSAPIVRTSSIEDTHGPASSRTQPLKRGSSFVLITTEESKHQPSSARLDPVGSPKKADAVSMNLTHSLVENILEMIVAVFVDQILSRKDFAGIGLFLKVPPGFQEHQAYFESFVLRNTLSSLSTTMRVRQSLLSEPRVLTNLQRFCAHLDEAVFEGWFIDGADAVLDFLGELLEHLQRPDISQLKSVRLCSEVIASMRLIVSRICLLRLSEPDTTEDQKDTIAFLHKLTYWQSVLFSADSTFDTFLKLFSYLLYDKLVSTNTHVREAAINLWRTFLVHKHDETSGVLQHIMNTDNMNILNGFDKIMELDNDAFSAWVDDHRTELDAIFFGKFASTWEQFVTVENRRTQENYKARVGKRREKLRLWVKEGMTRDDIIRRHEVNSEHWRTNIYAAELLKHQRSIQDSQDAEAFNESTWANMVIQLKRPCGFLDTKLPQKWQLDLTEGRSRMRMRLIPDRKAHLHNYFAKGTSTKTQIQRPLTINTRRPSSKREERSLMASPTTQSSKSKGTKGEEDSLDHGASQDIDDDYEMVDEPEVEAFEDKNRKVMRSLQRNDQIESVHNVSRIVGLEACEGLLIVGKLALYLIDDFFQRSDGEIVDVWQAPSDERDAYMHMISGRKAETKDDKLRSTNRETRSWKWDEVLSISKRRFLFREVGVELFFTDGRSYLLASPMPKSRNEIYQKLLSKSPSSSSSDVLSSRENRWRLEALRSPEDGPQSFGSRFTSVFAQGIASPATKKWIKGELSNFAYLMHVNTMAGRTFNDLTQYPVFPWVLADYTSDELDLTNPRTFRDLSKPMGCQTAERQMEFRERYQMFAEMGDHNAPPFHYGTHYSSAMIVTSYLIRLEPFVQSYLLLQGGSFDHADRLFYSIEKAWMSASRENMTDVRELIPEFFYLPEMFVNTNAFDFGTRQGRGGRIDNVALPPWAKGDPNIFIAKHREALESDYVSKHLHQWIDLVFGHKQRGEAALEATNIFHHLSYHGAKNLDEIDDQVERMATIGIIHNFGQTPHQVFQRSHPAREDAKTRPKRLDTLANTLTKLPFPLLEQPDRITSLTFSEKTERVLGSGPFRVHIPPNYDAYLEWGFVDGSVRFFAADQRAPAGLFEHVHQTQVSAAAFADRATLVTAGEDGVVAVWSVTGAPRHPDLALQGCLCGHAAPVTCLAVSPAFRTLLSAAADGSVLLWDLNRRDLVRVLARGGDEDGADPVDCARIHSATGTIALARGARVALHTLNGARLLEQHACVEGDEAVTCCAFYEGAGAEHVERLLLFTGHRRGAVNVWALAVHEGRWGLELVKRMVHADAGGQAHSAAITAVMPMPLSVYTGDEEGRVHQWDCIQRQDGR